MQSLKKLLLSATAIGAIVSGGYLAAQPADTANKNADKKDEVTVPLSKQAKLSPKQMQSRSNELIEGMQSIMTRTVELQKLARSQKDVIKLNCVNDKLLQIKQLLNIAESARTDLIEAIAQQDEADRYHHFGQVTIASEKVGGLRDEAEACVGEEIVFLGPTEIQVDRPTIPDDPTVDDGFDFDIEPPSYASPFL